MCAAFQVRCTSCYLWDSNPHNQTSCTKHGDTACTREDMQQNRTLEVMTVMSAASCVSMSISWLNQSLYADEPESLNLYAHVKCCSTDGCNYAPTPVSTPPSQLPLSAASSSPPAEPGNGPCEKPGLTWEVRSVPRLVRSTNALPSCSPPDLRACHEPDLGRRL